MVKRQNFARVLMSMTVKVVYFAWVRVAMGAGQETIDLNPAIKTIGDLKKWLIARDDNGRKAFQDQDTIRYALNHELVPENTPIKDGDEVAFFPPVTGG